MVPVMSLWVPIIVSAVVVFFASFVMHMVLKYHRKDYGVMANEDAVLDALRAANAAPGDYMIPRGGDGPDAMKNPVWLEKMERGPVAIITLRKPGKISLTPFLAAWFIYCVVTSLFAAYVTGRALGPGAEYISVFRFASSVAFIGYALALWQNAIWYSRKIRTVILQTIDGLIWALLTGGVFGWLWPR